MSLDNLVKEAACNGGKANEILSTSYAARTSNAPNSGAAPALPTDSKLIAREGRDYKNRPNRFRSFREGDFLRDMDDVNRAIKVAKEYKKNIADKERARQVRRSQVRLGRSRIDPLQMPAMHSQSLRFLPSSLVSVADSLSKLTGLDVLGIVYALLGVISIATWGRVTIKLAKHWIEAAIDMLLLVSPSGTRKSALVRMLRRVFDLYCAKANEGHEEMQKAQRERQLLGKAAAKLAHKKIANAFNEVVSMTHTEGANHIKAAVREVVAFEKKMLCECETREPVQLLVDKATPFQLAATLQQQGECQGCITAEGSMIQSKLFMSGAVADLFLRGHTQEPYVYENAKQRIALAHPSLPMVHIVQPKVATEFYANEALNAVGATARFVPYFYDSANEDGSILHGRAFDDYDDDVDAQISAAMTVYRETIFRRLKTYHTQDKNAERYQVAVDPEALKLVRDFERYVRTCVIPHMPEAAKACLLKAHGQAVRFAWDIHAWNHEFPHTIPITTEEMEQGIELVRATFEHIRYAYDPCGLQAYLHAQKILASLNNITDRWEQDKLLDEGIDSSTIQRRTGLKAEVTNNALRLLNKHNYLVDT